MLSPRAAVLYEEEKVRQKENSEARSSVGRSGVGDGGGARGGDEVHECFCFGGAKTLKLWQWLLSPTDFDCWFGLGLHRGPSPHF